MSMTALKSASVFQSNTRETAEIKEGEEEEE
jgi:hypothetical protein